MLHQMLPWLGEGRGGVFLWERAGNSCFKAASRQLSLWKWDRGQFPVGMLAGEAMLLGTARMQSISLGNEHPLPGAPAWRGPSSSWAPKQCRVRASPWFLSSSVDANHLEAEPVHGNPTLHRAALSPFTRKSSSPFLHKKKKKWIMLEKFGTRPSKDWISG